MPTLGLLPGHETTVLRMTQALYGVAPGNIFYNQFLAVDQSIGDATFAARMTAAFSGVSDGALATTVITNLGLSSFATLQPALTQLFAFNGVANRGQIILNLVNLLANDNGTLDPTYSAASTTFNNLTNNAYAYSINPANTGPQAVSGTTTTQNVTLTTGADTVTGTNFFGSLSAFNFDGKGPTLTIGDNLTGVGTTNVLTLTDGYAAAGVVDIIPAGVTLNNIQNVILQTAGNAGAAGNPFNTAPYSSVTSTTVTSSGAAGDVVQASASSTISVNHNSTTGGVTTTGGTDVTVTTTGVGGVTVGGTGTNQLETGNVTVTANGSGAGAGTFTAIGGKNVTLTVVNANATGAIKIGNTPGLTSLTKAYNPSGAISVTSNSLNGAGNVETIMGGTTVNVTAMGDTITIGDAAATEASNQPSGNVTVSDMMAKAFDNLTGPGTSHNAVAGGAISVQGGANVTVTTNAGAGVTVGTTKVAGTRPSGTVTVTDTASDLKGAFGIGAYGFGTTVFSGTAVTVNEAGGSVTIGSATAADDPTGAVNVIETVSSKQAVTIDGGNGVTVSAKGQAVTIGANSGTSGAQSVTQSSVYTGNALGNTNAGSAVTVDGGTTVTINTTGGNVAVGKAGTTFMPTGAVSITNTFSGALSANASTVNVLGGSTVSITEANTTNNAINVGVAPVLNAGGTALTNVASDPTGNVTIMNAVTNGTTTTYGTSATAVYTNGATTVAVTGAGATTIADVNSFTATATGKAIGTSALASVSLDGVAGAVAIYSGALTSLTIADSLKGSTATTVNTTVPGAWTQEGAHTLALTLSNDSNAGTAVTDPTATALTISTTGTASNTIGLTAAKATSLTFNNAAAVTVAAGATMSATATDTVTATGAGALTLGDTTAWVGNAKLASIDASGAAGAVTATINGNVTSFKGGSGNDVVTVNTGATQAINGGLGNNTVILTASAATYNPLLSPTGPISADFTNFQTLGLAGGTTGSYDVSSFNGVVISGAAAALTETNAGAGETLAITAAPGFASAWSLGADTTSDALTVTVGIDGTTGAGFAANTLTTGSAAGAGASIETVTVNSVGKSTMTGNHAITLADAGKGVGANTGTTTLNVSGDAKVAVTAADGTITKITVTNSAATDVTAVKAAAAGISITGGAGTLTASTNTASTAITSKDTVTTGAGGGTITVGAGGAGGLVGSTGNENISLAASTAVRDTIIIPDAPVAGDGARGVVSSFKVASNATSDVLTLTTAGGGGTQSLVNNIASQAGLSGSTYSVSNGMFTLLVAAGAVAVPATAGLAELQDVKLLVDGVTAGVGGGINKIGAVTISGTTYVVSSGNAVVGASMGATETSAAHPVSGNAEAQAAVVQLSGVSGITGFGQSAVGTVATGASNTIMLSNLALAAAPNTGSAVAGSTNNFVDTNIAHDALSVATTTGVTNNYNNMASWAQLDIGNAAMTGGTVNVTQLGTGDTLVLHGLVAGSVLDSLTFNNDANLLLDSTTAGFTLKSLVDATNTVTTLMATGGNSLTVNSITDTALTTIDGSKMTGGTLTVGAAATPLALSNLTVKVGGGAALAVTVSGSGDTITGGDAGDTIVVNGSTATIKSGLGTNTITATGTGESITVGNEAGTTAVATVQTIHAAGAGDTITFATTAADGTAVTFTNAGSQVDGGSGSLGIGNNSTVNFATNAGAGAQTVILTGDVTGATSTGSYAMTTLGNVSAAVGDNILKFGNATVAEASAAASLGASQVNVAGATSLANALDLAAATAAMSQQAGTTAAGNIAANTGVFDWFQYGGNTYIVEAVNNTGTAAAHTALGANDAVVKIVGLVDLSGVGAIGVGGTVTM